MTCAPVVTAVHTALTTELADATRSPAARAHLLRCADVSFHRAILEEQLLDRRAAAAPQVRSTLSLTDSVDHRDLAAHAAARVRELVGSPSDSDERDALSSLVATYLATDLPELGPHAPAERRAAEDDAMNWMGVEAPATASTPAVQEFLDAHQPTPRREVHEVRCLAGGFSKTTILVTCTSPAGPEELVLRQAPPGRDGTGLAAEFGVIRAAWKAALPVPEPLFVVPSANTLGGPTLVTRRAAGTNLGDVFGPGAGVEPELADALAVILARLHAIDASDVEGTPVPPMATRAQMLACIDEQEGLIRDSLAHDPVPNRPLYDLLFAWLRAHVPDDIAEPVLLHGDPGFHNLLVDRGAPSALLDWERARIGDAAQDLAYVRPLIEGVVPWERFLAAYVDAGGRAPTESSLHYYAIWHDAWRAAGSLKGKARLLAAPEHMLDAVVGLLHAPRFLRSGVMLAYGEVL